MQWFDVDMISGQPLSSNPAGGSILGSTNGPVPIIRLFGVNQDGQSILAFVHGFTPYFYASISSSIDLNERNLIAIRNVLEQRVSVMFVHDDRLIILCLVGS
jgi:DNA polymerase delta subunit 1